MAKNKGQDRYIKEIAKRKAWIVELEAGWDLFDEATLKALLKGK